MKKIILLAIVSLLGITISFAQKGKNKNLTPEQRIEKHMKRLNKHLALTSDQQIKVKDIVTAKVNGMEELRNNGKDKKANRPARKSIRQTFDKDLTAVLNADQLKKYEAWKAEKKAKRQAKKGAKSGGNDDIEIFE